MFKYAGSIFDLVTVFFALFVFLSVYMWLEDDFTFHLLSGLLLFIIAHAKLPGPQSCRDSPIFPLPSKHRSIGNLLEMGNCRSTRKWQEHWETMEAPRSHKSTGKQEHWKVTGALGVLGNRRNIGELQEHGAGKPQEHREAAGTLGAPGALGSTGASGNCRSTGKPQEL